MPLDVGDILIQIKEPELWEQHEACANTRSRTIVILGANACGKRRDF